MGSRRCVSGQGGRIGGQPPGGRSVAALGDTGRAMPQENVQVVRGFYEAFARGDLESALAAFGPEIVAYDHDIPDPGEYCGGWKDCFVGRPTGRAVGKVGVVSPRSSSRLVIVWSRSFGS